MSKDYLESFGTEVARFADQHAPFWRERIEARTQDADDEAAAPAPDSLICADSGRVTLHDVSDLRAQLEQFRLGRKPATARGTSRSGAR